ncbi:unnamed protein product [Rodentolepis nana]|uniref:Nuclear apoptosis-inducing factor 1 n=1 Tax=Rodentolepis nana TaxID=102285 RepID=A0A0R3TB21_RODNA|nr:unnamed protein product [Rodentolepis nana]
MDTEQMSSVKDNCQGATNSSPSLKHDELSKGIRGSTFHSQIPLVTKMSLAQLDSLIVPFTRPKIDAFTEDEIKLMLEEIGKRRHILLTNPRKNSRVMKAAWEEVASSVALRSSSDLKRTPKQIKRKWRDIVTKTKKKIQEGQLKQEVHFNEITAMVTQFLASTSQEMRQDEVGEVADSDEEISPFVTTQSEHLSSYYDQLDSVSDNDTGNRVKEINDENLIKAQPLQVVQSAQGNEYYSSNSATHLVHDNGHGDATNDSSDSDVVMITHTSGNELSLHIDEVGGNLEHTMERSQMEESPNKTLLQQLKDEHTLRMEVLEMKRRYWQIKIDALLQERQILETVNGVHKGWK